MPNLFTPLPPGIGTCWQLDLMTMKKNPLRTDRRREQQSEAASHTRAPSVAAAAAAAAAARRHMST